MKPPKMASWNLALRFGLEIAALVGFAIASWRLAPDNLRWVAVIVFPIIAATVWGVFNVLDDPSRSGKAPVEVSGVIRLTIELLILGAGVAVFALADRPIIAVVLAALISTHYAMSWNRIEWLIKQ